MYTVLLVIIYLAFISLGLPDSILGASWPSMYRELAVPVSGAGVISMIIAAGTIVSSLMSGRLVRRLGTGLVTLYSVGLTAVALLGFSVSGVFWMLCVWAVPFGLGAGSVDAALNHFVSLHYQSRHMNWLHSFWGIGAAAGPMVTGICLANGLSWSAGYRMIGLAQLALVLVFALSLPLWKRARRETDSMEERNATALGIRQAMCLPGAKPTMLAFFCYCGLETTTGLWIASYLVLTHGVAEEQAAQLASIFFLGITAGRMLGGLVSNRLGNPRMVWIGQILILCGVAVFFIPAGMALLPGAIVLLGLGCAPVFPGMLHETPINFGKRNAQSMMGMQMASAYAGTTLIPPLFGLIGHQIGTGVLPLFMLVLAGGLITCTHVVKRRQAVSGR